jgi:hypothetical protein
MRHREEPGEGGEVVLELSEGPVLEHALGSGDRRK